MSPSVSVIAERRAAAASKEALAANLAKAGRDVAILGWLVTACAAFMKPDLSPQVLLLMKLAGPVGSVLYCTLLYVGTRLRCKAVQLTADLPAER